MNEAEKVIGYTVLTPYMVANLNELKQLELDALAIIRKIDKLNGYQSLDVEWRDRGIVQLEQAFMSLCRSIEKPGGK